MSTPPGLGDSFRRDSAPLSPIGARTKFRPESKPSTAPVVRSGVETHDAQTQSDFRENDTQTDPYSPDYLPPDGPEPEVLYLAKLGLKFDHGGPIGQDDLDFIERARVKRGVEQSLPPMLDETSTELRRVKLEEQERREFEYRDSLIRKEHQQKLETLQRTLHLQEEQREMLNAKKVENIMARAAEQRDVAWLKIQKRRLLLLRKLARDRENIEGKKVRRDIIEDYTNYSSKVYAPLQRDGNKIDPSLVLQDIRPPMLDNARTLASLESVVQQGALSVEPHPVHPFAPTADLRTKNKTQRQEKALDTELDKLEESVRQAKKRKEDRERRPVFAEKIAKPPPRPPTPSVEEPTEDEAEMQAVLLLQRLLRGRAMQNMMYEGKRRRSELIQELKAADAAATAGPVAPLASPSSEQHAALQAAAVQNLMDEFLAGIVGQGLDFLSKELVRVNEHRRISAIVQNAERIRRMREAAESGRRQLEEHQRAREDAQYRQVMAANQRTAQTYFEWVLDEAINVLDTEIAKREAEAKRKEEERKALEPVSDDDVVNDLVFSFLFPLVETELQKSSAQVASRAPAVAVRAELNNIFADINRAMTFVK